MRDRFPDAAIHECAGVALVAVADDVLQVAAGLGHRAPLQAGGIAAAAASAQPALGDPWMTPLGVISVSAVEQGLVAVAGDVVVDLFRIDVAGVLQNHAHLLVEVLAQVALQFGNGLAAQAVDDGFGVARRYVLVESRSGSTRTSGPERAGPHAAGAADEDLLCRRPRRP